jgi:tetratricopeptide (TPR) repeat protein
MRSIMQDIQSEFQRFIASRTENLLIVPCEPDHSALLFKALEALDDDPESLDIFLIFGHLFTDPGQYVREIPPIISIQLDGVNQELVKRGELALPTPPTELTDESQKPSTRLVGLMRYVESLVRDERRMIWVFFPLEIDAANPYAELVNYVYDELKTGSLRITKLIVRDDAISPKLERGLGGQPNVKIYRPELDPESLEKKLNEKANDPRLPMEEHAQIQMMLAGFDVAHKRYDMALARNLELGDYFGRVGQRHQQAIVLNNIGDLHYTQNKFREAQTWYERAINLSVGLKSEPMVMYQSYNLGNALLMQNRFADALIYYGAMEQLARASNLPVQQVQALEQMGTANYRMGKSAEAAENWEKAVELSRGLKFEEGQRANLERLRDLYRELGDSRRLSACNAALSELKS